MSIYSVAIGNREYKVRITGNQVLVDGEPVHLDLVSLGGQGLHLIRQGMRSLELVVSPRAAGTYEVLARGRRLIARVDSTQHKVKTCGKTVERGDVVAPMPGLIVDVQVQPGEQVEAGQVLVVEEAMKMQMQLRAPFAGRVETVNVVAGGQVDLGDVLVRVAEDGSCA